MAYVALRFDTDARAADAWSDLLVAAGAMSVDIADPDADTADETPIYGEPGMDPGARWTTNRLTALFAADAHVDAIVHAVERAAGGRLPPYTTFSVPDQDWVRATQAQFGPIEITPALWIVPSWSKAVASDALNLVLDPGLAFGTGSHPTTRLCLQWLAQAALSGASVLDYGCGSGILAIAAARLGAAEVTGTDIDTQALESSRENARRNGVRASFVAPDALPGVRYDIVIANILSNPLMMLAPALAQRVRDGGAIVLSGVLASQAAEVSGCYAPWFRIGAWKEDDGWVALAGVRES